MTRIARALLALLLASTPAVACRDTPVEPAAPRFVPRNSQDLRVNITSLESLLERAEKSGLLGLGHDVELAVKERAELRRVFATVYDHVMVLDGHRRTLAEERDGAGESKPRRAEAFLLGYAADLALYTNTARFLEQTVGKRSYEVVLDEPAPDLGLPEGSWGNLKRAFNAQPWKRPLILAHAHHKTLASDYAAGNLKAHHAWAMDYVHERAHAMMKDGLDTGEIAARELGDLTKAGFQRVWFPGQTKVAVWMGDTKVRRKGKSLISREQIDALLAKLKPGDVLVQRRNWYLSNVGLPGFWTHAALYLGTPSEAGTELGAEWLDQLEKTQPKAMATWRQADEQAHLHRIIEAMSEGVVFTSLEHSADADYVGVLRPRVPTESVKQAVERALAYHGRPYDFDFDFLSDQSLVCTELVYKCFEPGERPGLSLPLDTMLGRPTLPANDLVRHYAEQTEKSDRLFDFVAFLDGEEHAGLANEAPETYFRTSHLRPRWDVIQR